MEKKVRGLSDDVVCLKGVGPRIASKLRARGLGTVEDILYFVPLRYEDRRAIVPISEAKEGEKAVVMGQVIQSRPVFYPRSRKRAYEVLLSDDGGRIRLKWFHGNMAHLGQTCREGSLVLAAGEVTRFGAVLQMVHPQVRKVDGAEDEDRHRTVVPVYSEVEGVRAADLRKIIGDACEYADGEMSLIPGVVAEKHGLVGLGEALTGIHRPGSLDGDERPPGMFLERLILEEFFLCQAALLLGKKTGASAKPSPRAKMGPHFAAVMNGLPFSLTAGQQRVIGEIGADMGRRQPMNRLLQGDVGSGKTICAVAAACLAVDGGCQAAIMAPTEILAEQHYLAMHRLFEDGGLKVSFVRGDMGVSERRRAAAEIRSGAVDIVVGTHAILGEDLVFKRLGLVIIDEQHRFGVAQRKALQEKASVEGRSRSVAEPGGPVPHLLAMTATPIPRTLSMVVYGNLDVSLLTDMPAGRGKVVTRAYPFAERDAMLAMVRDELDRGRQAFMVYPLLDESNKTELLAARSMAQHLGEEVFRDHTVGLLHGRMRPQEKEAVMADFKARRIDLLVCTTVVEVGIDVPNATVMVIEHAERFGLSQLHQLRGRVGRGGHSSKCLLVTGDGAGAQARKRLKILERTTDGFLIAEEDMKLRGPGEMLGVRQAGMPNFRVGDLLRHGPLMVRARRLAEEAVPGMSPEAGKWIIGKAIERFGTGIGFGEIS